MRRFEPALQFLCAPATFPSLHICPEQRTSFANANAPTFAALDASLWQTLAAALRSAIGERAAQLSQRLGRSHPKQIDEFGIQIGMLSGTQVAQSGDRRGIDAR